MKFGAVIGICTDRDEYQRAAIESIRAQSEPGTEIVAVFNGIAPFVLPPGIEALHYKDRIGREQGTWRVVFDLAVARGWDFACDFHDDFSLLEPGWEAEIRRLAGLYRVAIAAFVGYDHVCAVPSGDGFSMHSGNLLPQGASPLVTTVDGCGIAWGMSYFKQRGRFTSVHAAVGYGETQAGFDAMRDGWACVRIAKKSVHHPGTTQNARGVLGFDAGGQSDVFKNNQDVWPADVIDETHVRLRDNEIDVSNVIPVFRPLYDEREAEATARVLRRGWTASGPETAAFEHEFGSFLGATHVVATSSCTAALHLALAALTLSPGDEVIVPPLTFASTVHAVAFNGATPVFADVDKANLCLSPDAVEASITPWTRAIVVVHFGGAPADMERLYKIANAHDVAIIEDCAHAVGTLVNGAPAGADVRSAFSCFSFHAVKNLSMGDGGAVVARNAPDAVWLREMRWCGVNKETHTRTDGPGYKWDYAVNRVGYKYQMPELNAAVGRVQLTKLAAQNNRRRQIAAMYNDAFAGRVETPATPLDVSSWHLYQVRVAADRRQALIDFLASQRIQAGVHYKPINDQPAYAVGNTRTSTKPTLVAATEWRRLVSLPMSPAMSDADVARVIAGVRAFT